MLLPPLRSRSFICVPIFMHCLCSAFQPFCSVGIYGIPNYRDCLSAWHSMPFVVEPSFDSRSWRYELWSEPQYLRPPFGAITNRYKPLPINQLPKIWRYDTCRLAIMSLGRPNGYVWSVLWSGSWRAVLDQMHALFVCGSPASGISPSGGFMPFINPGSGLATAALYIYSAYSPFEDEVNMHMSTGLPIRPVTSIDQPDAVGNSSFLSLTNDTQHIRHMPLHFSLLRDITLLD